MILSVILMLGAVVGLLVGALLRRVGAVRLWLDLVFGLCGAFVAGAMGTSALLTGLTRVDLMMAAGGAGALVVLAHIASAVLRPVHAKYYRR
jgi:uncharacterized membrane protein YeaQ/YmgE (transglycosylase-associated protein family)